MGADETVQNAYNRINNISGGKVTEGEIESIVIKTKFDENELVALYKQFKSLEPNEQQLLTNRQLLNYNRIKFSPFGYHFLEAFQLCKIKDKNFKQKENEQLNGEPYEEIEEPDPEEEQRRIEEEAGYRVPHLFEPKDDNVPHISFEMFCIMFANFSSHADIDKKTGALFRLFDFDNDGKISAEDIVEYLENMTLPYKQLMLHPSERTQTKDEGEEIEVEHPDENNSEQNSKNKSRKTKADEEFVHIGADLGEDINRNKDDDISNQIDLNISEERDERNAVDGDGAGFRLGRKKNNDGKLKTFEEYIEDDEERSDVKWPEERLQENELFRQYTKGDEEKKEVKNYTVNEIYAFFEKRRSNLRTTDHEDNNAIANLIIKESSTDERRNYLDFFDFKYLLLNTSHLQDYRHELYLYDDTMAEFGQDDPEENN